MDKGSIVRIGKNESRSEINLKPFEYSLSLIGGKWKLNILFWLAKKRS